MKIQDLIILTFLKRALRCCCQDCIGEVTIPTAPLLIRFRDESPVSCPCAGCLHSYPKTTIEIIKFEQPVVCAGADCIACVRYEVLLLREEVRNFKVAKSAEVSQIQQEIESSKKDIQKLKQEDESSKNKIRGLKQEDESNKKNIQKLKDEAKKAELAREKHELRLKELVESNKKYKQQMDAQKKKESRSGQVHDRLAIRSLEPDSIRGSSWLSDNF